MADESSTSRRKRLNAEFGGRLQELRKRAGFKTQEAGFAHLEACGFSREKNTYFKYEQGRRNAPLDVVAEIVAAFDVPEASNEWLAMGTNPPGWVAAPPTTISPSPRRLVPRLTPEEASEMPGAYERLVTSERLREPVMLKRGQTIGPKSFLFDIVDDSMVPTSPYEPHRFQQGDTVLIDPDRPPKPGDFVCAVLEGSDVAIFRRYKESRGKLIKPQEFSLEPLNASYSTEDIKSDKDGRIIGRMIQHIRNY